MSRGEKPYPSAEIEDTNKQLHLPHSLFGFQFGFQLQQRIRRLDPIADNIEHFSLTHETLYSNRIMARALPDVIFAKVAVVPEIATVLDHHGHGGIMKDPKKRNSMMMQSFGRTLDKDPEIAKKEATRLGRIHATMPIKNLTENMKFVGNTMILAERDMLRLIGSTDMENHFQASITERWTSLLEEMADAMNIDLGNYKDRSIQEIEAERDAHIAKYGQPSTSGKLVANACRQDFAHIFRPRIRTIADQFYLSMFDKKTSALLDFPPQRTRVKNLARAGVRGYIGATPLRLVRERRWQDI